jgi:hypothetical protein
MKWLVIGIAVLVASVATPANASSHVVITAAGDIATGGPGDFLTSQLIQRLDPARVLTLGDNAYSDGTLRQFNLHYDPTWGVFKRKTSPPPAITTTTRQEQQGTSRISGPGRRRPTTPMSWADGG